MAIFLPLPVICHRACHFRLIYFFEDCYRPFPFSQRINFTQFVVCKDLPIGTLFPTPRSVVYDCGKTSYKPGGGFFRLIFDLVFLIHF